MEILVVSWSMMILSIASVFIWQPFSLGLCLISTALVICVMISFNCSSLLAFLLFMSYVGGVMILFLYVLSVFPNEQHQSKLIWQLSWLLLVVLGSFVLLSTDKLYSASLGNPMLFHYMGLKSFWDLFLFMALFLLFIMMMVSYLCMKKRVPLRSMKR